MNYYTLKNLQKESLLTLSKLEMLRSVAEKTTKALSQAPARGTSSQNIIDEIIDLTYEYDNKIKIINEQKEILKDTYEGNCIMLHLFSGYSWNTVAKKLGGYSSSDAIRKMCNKFEW